ncbi:MAG: class I SAM-dependent methyltransferase [Elusimicrobia bacterium]|nr:class I SAM-dependent methyltransferase [Elusimicrobiota bacterium]
MSAPDAVELLDVGLLADQGALREIDHWLGVFNWANGWHYDLDMIWILRNIAALGLPRGSVILDAGAGLGMMQFILAARGYNVISLDFTQRRVPRFSRGIFRIELDDRPLAGYTHEYMQWMTHGQRPAPRRSLWARLSGAACRPGRTWHSLLQRARGICNVPYLLERRKPHDKFGTITFLRGTFNEIPRATESVDLLVSVSAFEHNTYQDMPASVKEFERVLKKGASMLITTSAAEKEDWYFEPSKGWNFAPQTLRSWFGIPGSAPLPYQQTLADIRGDVLLRSRLHPYYRHNGDNGLPFGRLEEAQYVPVGIRKSRRA